MIVLLWLLWTGSPRKPHTHLQDYTIKMSLVEIFASWPMGERRECIQLSLANYITYTNDLAAFSSQVGHNLSSALFPTGPQAQLHRVPTKLEDYCQYKTANMVEWGSHCVLRHVNSLQDLESAKPSTGHVQIISGIGNGQAQTNLPPGNYSKRLVISRKGKNKGKQKIKGNNTHNINTTRTIWD